MAVYVCGRVCSLKSVLVAVAHYHVLGALLFLLTLTVSYTVLCPHTLFTHGYIDTCMCIFTCVLCNNLCVEPVGEWKHNGGCVS